jgi:DNA-binding NarL/FixJ family response regulator
MNERTTSCALLADRHNALIEGVRDLLETTFGTLFVVADAKSLLDGVVRLRPTVVLVDLSLAPPDGLSLLRLVRELSADSKLLALSVHDDPSVAQLAFDAGADGVVLKRAIATDLLSAIDTVRAGERYVSSGIAGLSPKRNG